MFDNLLEAEQKLLEACQKGVTLSLSNKRPSKKTKTNEIRGAFLRQLILSNDQKIDPKGIQFRGAYISGAFDFSYCETHLPFMFTNSTFEEEIDFSDSKIRYLNLHASGIHSMNAQGLLCEGDIFLRNDFEAKGIVDFISAQIGGSLDCSNGKFTNENGDALNCNSAKIQGNVFLNGTFDAKGKVDFGSAQIGSSLICSNGKFTNENGDALNCNRANIQGIVFLDNAFESKGKVNFGSVQLGSSLICSNGKFTDENGDALNCNSAKIQGGVFLNATFDAKGKVNFGSAQIGSSLTCSNGKFTNENGDALNCHSAKIQGSVFLDAAFESKGKVSFGSTQIGSSLICSNGKFTDENGNALNCDKSIILGSVFLKDGFEAKGKVNFGSAQIGSNFECSNGKFTNENRDALNCHSAKIQGSVFLNNTFNVNGIVSFSFAQIGKTLFFSNLNIIGNFSLASAKVDTIKENEKFWAKDGFGNLYLDGLEYNHLSGENLDSSSLKKWLKKMPQFKPQPYKQLAKVLRNMGHNRDADEIMIEYNNIITEKSDNKFITILRQIYGKTAGYGYKPIRVLKTMALIWILCGTFFWAVSKVAVFAPSDPLVFQKKDFYECNVNTSGTPITSIFNWSDYNSTNNWVANTQLDGEYSTFSPYWYSLDILLPIVDLQMDKDWGQFVPSDGVTLNHVTRWIVWFEILAGWIFSLILVAILSGLAKNEKD